MKTLTTKLNTLTTNKVEIKSLNTANIKLIKEVFPLIINEIKTLKEQDKYKDTKKATLAKIVKLNLASKEAVINTCLTLVIEGLNISHDLPLSKINQCITLVHNKTITKSWLNKASEEQIITKLSNINKAKKLSQASKLINGTPKQANKTAKAQKIA